MDKNFTEMSPETLEHELGTDTVTGISKSTAKARLKKNGKNTVFSVKRRSFLSSMTEPLRSPAMILCLAVAVISICFGRYPIGIASTVILLSEIVFSGLLSLYFARTTEAAASVDVPKAKVIRSGKLYMIPSENLVAGDLAVFEKGDIISGDIIVTSSNDLTVLEPVFDEGGRTRFQKSKKSANVSPNTDSADRTKKNNFISASSAVLSGEGRGIVCSVGADTYIGALRGGVRKSVGGYNTELTKRLYSILSRISFASVLMVLPLTVIGVFTSRGGHDLLDIFLLSLTLTVGASPEIFKAYSKAAYAYSIQRLANYGQVSDTALIKNPQGADMIRNCTDLILLGTSALCGGKLSVDSVYTQNEELYGSEYISDKVTRVARDLCVYMAGSGKGVESGITEENYVRTALEGFIDEVGVDREELMIKTSSSFFKYYEKLEASCVFTEFNDGKANILLSDSPSLIEFCTHILVDGETVGISGQDKLRLSQKYREYVSRGCTVAVMAYSDEGTVVFEAMISMSREIGRGVGENIKSLSSEGVKTTVFLNERTPSELSPVFGSGISDTVCTPEGESLGVAYMKHRVFASVPKSDIAALVRALRSEGKTVAVLGSVHEDFEVLEEADLAIATDDFSYMELDREDSEYLKMPDEGREYSPSCAPLVRRRADMLVKRSSSKGGGLSGFINARNAQDRLSATHISVISLILCVYALALGITVVPLLTGSMLVSPSAALYVLMFILPMSMLLLTVNIIKDRRTRESYVNISNYVSVLNEKRELLISSFLCGLLLYVPGCIIGFLLENGDTGCKGAVFVSMMLITLLIYIRIGKIDKTSIKDNTTHGLLLPMIGIAGVVLLSIIATSVRQAFGVSLSLGFVLMLVSSVPVFFLSEFLSKNIGKAIDKKLVRKRNEKTDNNS